MIFMTDAEDIARVLIREYIDIGHPITNMKLQKILYYAWIEYYREHNSFLFDDIFYAWRFGPVVKSVYYNYRIYAGNPIKDYKDPNRELPLDIIEFLKDFANRHKDRTTNGLIYRAHVKGTPCHDVYVEGNKNIMIPFNRIIEYHIGSG